MKRNSFLGLLILLVLALGAYVICRGTSKQASVASQPEPVANTSQNQAETSHDNPASSQTKTDSTSVQHPDVPTQQNDSIPADWKTYTNDKLGFSFRYPDTWVKNGEEANVIDLSGTIKVVDINFVDTVSKSTLLVAYHLPPSGAEFYHYSYKIFHYQTDRDSHKVDRKEIMVAGQKALMASDVSNISGKGTALNPPLRTVVVDFLDVNKTGTIEFQLDTPVTN